MQAKMKLKLKEKNAKECAESRNKKYRRESKTNKKRQNRMRSVV